MCYLCVLTLHKLKCNTNFNKENSSNQLTINVLYLVTLTLTLKWLAWEQFRRALNIYIVYILQIWRNNNKWQSCNLQPFFYLYNWWPWPWKECFIKLSKVNRLYFYHTCTMKETQDTGWKLIFYLELWWPWSCLSPNSNPNILAVILQKTNLL